MNSLLTSQKLSYFLRVKLVPVGLSFALLTGIAFQSASAQVAPALGTANTYAVLGGSTVTNTGATLVSGDLGVSPGSAITGFPSGILVRGGIHAADAAAIQAQTDSASAYTSLSQQACQTTYSTPTDLGGLTLGPGVYCFTSSSQITGTLTLDAAGDPNAIWIFEVGSTLTTLSNSSVTLINSAQHRNVFWQVGSSATLGTNSTFAGDILASSSITLTTNAALAGRALALNGAVTLDTNSVSDCACLQTYAAITASVGNTITVAPSKDSIAGTVFGAALSPDGASVWVAAGNDPSMPGFVSLVDVATQTVGRSVTVGADPADIAFSYPGGRAFVTNFHDSSLSVVDVKKLKVMQTLDLTATPLHHPLGVAYQGGYITVATQGTDNVVPVISTITPLTPVRAIAMPGQSGRPGVVPSGVSKYANKVVVPVFVGSDPGTGHPGIAIIHQPSGKVLARLTLSTSHAAPEAVVVSPDGKYAYISLFDSTGGDGGVWVVSLATMTTKTVILTCDPANYGEAISADGKYLLVAGFLQNQIALIDTATSTLDAIIPTGNQPNSIVITRDSSQAFVTNQSDGTLSVVSFTPTL